MPDAWDEIAPSPGPEAVNLRRADVGHPLDFFRGRDHNGRYVFELHFPEAGRSAADLPRLAGLQVDVRPSGDLFALSLVLLDGTQVDVFRALCSNLLDACRSLGRGLNNAGVDIVIARLRRWQELLRLAREKVLSRSEVVGLFGELSFLRAPMLEHLQAMEAVTAWRGPHQDEQDFQYANWLVEVKTQLSSADARLRIASEHQLDTASGPILISHQRLSVGDGASGALTLNSLVATLREQLRAADPLAMDQFESTLIEYGFAANPAYDQDAWLLNDRTFFRVTDGFPCLTAGGVPDGVSAVRYEIDVDACRPFSITEEEAIEWLFSPAKETS